jgi:hypothetical protein
MAPPIGPEAQRSNPALGTRLDARGTMSRDGGPREDDLQLSYERLDS